MKKKLTGLIVLPEVMDFSFTMRWVGVICPIQRESKFADYL